MKGPVINRRAPAERSADTGFRDVGSPRYLEALEQEAAYWEGVAAGAVDIGAAAWRDAALNDAVHGTDLARALDLVVARGRRVLELGCGGGGISMQLARRGCVADGVDIAAGLIALGERQIEERCREERWPGSARLFVGDMNRLTLEPDSYDVVLAHAALHHVVDLPHLLDEVHRALRPGGSLICMDHMEPSRAGLLLRYALLTLLPTAVPYRRKPVHIFNRAMARMYRRWLPRRPAPAAFTLPPHSPFEDVTGADAIEQIRVRFRIEDYRTRLAFADVVAGQVRLRSRRRELALARSLRRLDDWLIQHRMVRGQTYFLVARKG